MITDSGERHHLLDLKRIFLLEAFSLWHKKKFGFHARLSCFEAPGATSRRWSLAVSNRPICWRSWVTTPIVPRCSLSHSVPGSACARPIQFKPCDFAVADSIEHSRWLMGNSAAIVLKHYAEIVDAKAALETGSS